MSLKISRILHAGYIFESDQNKIIFDPIFENPFSRNAYAFPDIIFDFNKIKKLKFDAVFISHFHDDHCSLESLNYLNRETPIYLYCLYEELFIMIHELGFKNVHALKIDSSICVGDFEITPRRALDADVDSIFHIKAEGFNILNVVDSWIDPETLTLLAETKKWDIVLWPFQTMREVEVISPHFAEASDQKIPPEWIEQLKLLNPRYLVSSSCQFIQEEWSWYRWAYFPISYQEFKIQANEHLLKTEVLRLNPSMSVLLNQNFLVATDSLEWIQAIGEQNLDYSYRTDLTPPSTAEVSKNFSVSQNQLEKVIDYCKIGLIEKYSSLETEEKFFQKSRHWQLRLYTHTSEKIEFNYILNGADIQLQDGGGDRIDWVTEVPAFKVFAALEQGESLSSMYLRVNDNIFDPQLVEEIKMVDVVEDPLIRCLFTGVFGAYQRDQLKRLKENNLI